MTELTTERGRGAPPRLSVVIASLNDGALLDQCVSTLAKQAASEDVEIIVVRAADRAAGVDRETITSRVPALHWIDAPAGTTVPRLRGLGIAAARSELIAMIEDDCVVAAHWCREAMGAMGSAAAIGGAVEPGPYRRALDWAVYFCEYGRFMLPVPSSPTAPLPGNNVVYARRAIAALPAASREAFHDVFVHAGWQRDSVPTRVSGSLVVHNVNSWPAAQVTSAPFHHGRAYAAERFGARSPAVRAGVAVLTIGLPVLKVARILSETLSRRRLTGRLALALPWIAVFVVCWSAGELTGCLRGPGRSPSRWR